MKGKRYEASPNEVRSDYLQWLCWIVHADDPDCSYIRLMKALYDHVFYWSVDNDDNRAEDGKTLRDMFAEQSLYFDYSAIGGPCRVLEMLVAFAIRINEDIMWSPNENRTVIWFWEMLANLGLDGFDDENWNERASSEECDLIIERWLSRNFDADGVGGIFPLRDPKADQTIVEYWYQMNAYFLENYGVEEDYDT